VKKGIVFIALALLVAALLPLRASASGELTFAVGSAGALTRGSTITIPVVVSNNPGFTAVGFILTYDPAVLEITGVTSLATQMPLNAQFALTTTPRTQWIHMVNTGLANWSGNGPLLNISFTVLETAPLGASTLGLSFTTAPNGTPGNADGVILHEAITVGGSVTVVEPSPVTETAPTIPMNVTQPTPTPTPTPIPTASPEATPTPPAVQDTIPAASPSPLPDAPEPTPTPPPAVMQSVFIGQTYTSLAQEAAATNPTSPNTTANFGVVPQTGVPGITATLVALAINLSASLGLWGYVIYRNRRKRVKKFIWRKGR